jgi:hypothetical protein
MSWVRCPFGPPDPALARVRTGPLNFVLHLAMPYAPPRRARAAHGLQRHPKPVPVGLFHDGPARNSTSLRTHLGGPRPASRVASSSTRYQLPSIVASRDLALSRGVLEEKRGDSHCASRGGEERRGSGVAVSVAVTGELGHVTTRERKTG